MKVERITNTDGTSVLMVFECPGCGIDHAFTVESPTRPKWDWNGDMEKPTFSPSLLVRWPDPDGQPGNTNVCHSFVRDGVIEFLSDCTHKLAGQKVAMKPRELE